MQRKAMPLNSKQRTNGTVDLSLFVLIQAFDEKRMKQTLSED